MGCQPEILAPTGVTFDERDLHELQTLAELSLRHDVFVQESLSGNEATVERALAHKSALERLAFGCTAGNKLVHRLYFRESDGAGVVPIEQDLYVTLRCEGKGGKTVVRPDTLFFATDDINFAQREFEDEDGEKIWYDVLCPKNPNDGFTSDGEEEDPRGEGRAGEGASAHEGQVIETLEQFKEAAVAGDGVADGLRKQIAQEFRYLNVKDRMYLQFIWSQYASSHHASENKLTYGGDNSVDDWHYAPALQALQTVSATPHTYTRHVLYV